MYVGVQGALDFGLDLLAGLALLFVLGLQQFQIFLSVLLVTLGDQTV